MAQITTNILMSMSRISLKTISRFTDSLKVLRGLGIKLFSQLRLITMEGYKAKQAKENGVWGKIWGTPRASFHEFSPSGAAHT